MNLEFYNNSKNIDSSNFSKNLTNYLEKKKSYSIDRFEAEFAVCEDLQTGEFINIPINLLPINCKKGSIINLVDNKYVLDIEKTKQKQEEIKNLVNNLFKKKE